MTSYVPPKKNATYIAYLTLVSQATGQFQSNPTIAAGDFKVSTDGGAFGDLGTTPTVTPAASYGVKITLSATEMNGDNVLVVGHDAAGAEWDDVSLSLQPSLHQFDDISTDIASVQSDTNDIQSRLPAVLVGGRIDASAGAVATGAIDANALATDAVAEIVNGVWDELITGHLGAGSTGAALNGAGAAGDPWTTPIPGVYGAGTAGNLVGNALDAAVSSRAVAGDAMALTPVAQAAMATAIESLVADGKTWGECFKIFGAALAGKVSGGPANPVFRSMDDVADRITATADASGNRTNVTLIP